MRILALDQFGELGGAQQCLLDLIPALHQQGWSVHVAAPDGPLAARCREIGAAFSAIRCGPYSRGKKSAGDFLHFAFDLPSLRREIARLAECSLTDLIYVNGPRLLPAAAWASRNGRPILFQSHSFLGRPSSLFPVGLSLRSSRARVVAACRFVAEPLARWCGNPPEIVYNGVAASRYTRTQFAPRGVWRIGIVGRIAPEKGHTEFLKAARLLAEREKDCRFFVCGAVVSEERATIAYGKEVRRLAEGLSVEFSGWREPADSIFSELDLLAVPSAPGEATTRVILEAYAAGLPVVAYASGGIPEVVADRQSGLLVNPGTADALAGRIHELISGPRERLWELSRRGHREWREKYTLETYRSKMIKIISATVSEAGRETAAPPTPQSHRRPPAPPDNRIAQTQNQPQPPRRRSL